MSCCIPMLGGEKAHGMNVRQPLAFLFTTVICQEKLLWDCHFFLFSKYTLKSGVTATKVQHVMYKYRSVGLFTLHYTTKNK